MANERPILFFKSPFSLPGGSLRAAAGDENPSSHDPLLSYLPLCNFHLKTHLGSSILNFCPTKAAEILPFIVSGLLHSVKVEESGGG